MSKNVRRLALETAVFVAVTVGFQYVTNLNAIQTPTVEALGVLAEPLHGFAFSHLYQYDDFAYQFIWILVLFGLYLTAREVIMPDSTAGGHDE